MKISDVIENFIIEVMGDDKCAEISRNELASYFQCAPSQINYVLKTRFTTERGFNVVGQRGGGGFIRIEKFDAKADGYLESILPSLENPTSYTRSKQIICHLVDDGVISKDEGNLLSAVTCDKALTAPQHVADVIRSNILKETIIQILKR